MQCLIWSSVWGMGATLWGSDWDMSAGVGAGVG